MKARPVFFLLLFVWVFYHPYAQPQDAGKWGDAETAQKYVKWAQQAIDEERWNEALAALERAADFANVSSDISWLLATARFHEGKSRDSVLEALNTALEINRWVAYSKNHALLLKTEQLVAMREYADALSCLEQIEESADAVILRLLALRGAANSGNVKALARFRSLALNAMDRYPRDPRPLRIFFEYARNRNPEVSERKPGAALLKSGEGFELAESDLNLLELALRRLPFLLETDPDLAWSAAPFMRDTDAARRLIASYRAGGLTHREDFSPSARSIPPALNLGLIGDMDAVEELFGETLSRAGGSGQRLSSEFADNEEPVLDKGLITDIYNLLRSEEGRDLFTQKLLSFSGIVSSDDDRDGYTDSRAFYRLGVVREFAIDRNQGVVFDLRFFFGADGVPISAEYPVTGQGSQAVVKWERYPSVESITLAGETFLFRPADFQFAPVTFTALGGSKNHAGLIFPAQQYQYMELTRRAMISFCLSISRPSVEFDGAVQTIFLERGIPMQAVETINGKQVSVTEFERGSPVVQRLDLDLDGRMETVRRFRRSGPDFSETFDLHGLIASSESEWGEGRYNTGEMYLQDGSVVYSWDMDGGGIMNYSETETGKER